MINFLKELKEDNLFFIISTRGLQPSNLINRAILNIFEAVVVAFLVVIVFQKEYFLLEPGIQLISKACPCLVIGMKIMLFRFS